MRRIRSRALWERKTACLIRRLRAFCNADTSHTICVATSATIVDHNDPDAARNFASRFFGVSSRQAVTTVGEDYAKEIWDEPRLIPPEPVGDPGGHPQPVRRRGGGRRPIRGLAFEDAYQLLSGQNPGPRGVGRKRCTRRCLRNELVFGLNEELKTPRASGGTPGRPWSNGWVVR